MLAVLGVLGGLISLYVVQAQHTGTLGLAGVLVGIVGAVMTAGSVWTSIFVVPGLAQIAPALLDNGLPTVLVGSVISYSILGIGALLSGVATLRAGIFGRPAALTLVVGGVLCLAPCRPATSSSRSPSASSQPDSTVRPRPRPQQSHPEPRVGGTRRGSLLSEPTGAGARASPKPR